MIIYTIVQSYGYKKNSPQKAVFEVISCLIKQDRKGFASSYRAFNH